MPQFHSSDDLKVGTDMDITNDEKPASVIKDTGDDVTDTLDLSPKGHAKLLRKLDWHILPLISLLYLLAFLDRVNIGNAKVAGMETDLNLVGLRYNTAAAIFFVPYCLGQIPSNVILKLFRPSRWLPVIMIIWGLITTLMALVNTYNQLLAARFFLGLAEAGFYPGLAYYISFWYPRSERARRIALLNSAGIIAGAFGGLLAYSIEKMEGVGGLHGWQWIFCLEGLVTVVIALAAFFFISDHPGVASFLTEAERRYVVELLKKDSQGLATHYDFQFVLQALKDYKIYLQCVLYLGLVMAGYGISLFTPTIINDLGFSAANAQLLSIPPYISGAICTILIGMYSDRRRLRGPFIIIFASLAIVGYIIVYAQTKPGISYIGIMFIAMGVYPCGAVDVAWFSSNAGGDIKRGVAIAMINGFGNIGGICASFIFFDPPRFHIGLGTIMGMLSLTMLLSLVVMWDCNRSNRQKARTCSEGGITDDHNEEFKALGDDSPLFRYTL